jgi:Icc-related predicted phosphoesterase
MSTIFFCGDVHGDFQHVIEAVQAHGPDAIILLGDVQAKGPLEVELSSILMQTEVWFIHGNHDTDSEADHDHLLGSALADRNLHGRVASVAGVRIAGLGGIFREQIWRPPEAPHYASPDEFVARCGKGNRWRSGLPLKHRSSIFPANHTSLSKLRADVLVSHEAPSAHPHGFEAIDELARSLQVGKTFHGHHHDQLDYGTESARLGFDAFGVGLRGITDLDGKIIQAGEIDSARAGRMKMRIR